MDKGVVCERLIMTTKIACKKAKDKKKTVSEIICERLVEKIKQDNKLPWQKTFLPVRPINYISHKEYRGINLLLLQDCYAWITQKQLYDYNGRTKKPRTFKVVDKYNYSIACFYKVIDREPTEDELQHYNNQSASRAYKHFYEDENGELRVKYFILRYTKVFPVNNIKDDDGNSLPDISDVKALNEAEEVPEANEIVKNYCEFSKVKVLHSPSYSPCYSEMLDAVKMTNKELFTTGEEYYRTLFHELGHSTGTKQRLNRSCFKKYHATKERSREELIAEMCSLLLATECGFTDEFSVNNSDNYILSWIKYIKNNPQEVVWGMSQAEKACDHILLRKKEIK